MIIGRVWSLNKPRKWDKVNLLVLVSLRFLQKLEYTSGISSDLYYWGRRFRESGWMVWECGFSNWVRKNNKSNP